MADAVAGWNGPAFVAPSTVRCTRLAPVLTRGAAVHPGSLSSRLTLQSSALQVTAGTVALILRGLQRRRNRCPAFTARRATDEALSEGGVDVAEAPRRRRRRKPEAGMTAGSDLTLTAGLSNVNKVTCDCDLILNTVLEVEDLLTRNECLVLIDAARRRAASVGWAEVAHGNYVTQDVKVFKLTSRAVEIFQTKIAEPLKDIIAENFELPRHLIEVDDCFIVRYTAEEAGGQRSLRYHRDGSIVSSIISLSDYSEYEGGGTDFLSGGIFRPKQGAGIVFGGQRLHGGAEITKGERFICTVFFRCAKLSCRKEAADMDGEDSSDFLGVARNVVNAFGLAGSQTWTPE